MRTRIISAFPGTGKSYFHNNSEHLTLDSDSSEFSWVVDNGGNKVRNPDFPTNYISHIRENIGKVEFILVSSHAEVRQALQDACLFYYLMYPRKSCKEEYIERYKKRGSPQPFIDIISDNWDAWIRGCDFNEIGCKRIKMDSEWTISDEISHIIASENGEC